MKTCLTILLGLTLSLGVLGCEEKKLCAEGSCSSDVKACANKDASCGDAAKSCETKKTCCGTCGGQTKTCDSAAPKASCSSGQ